MTTDDDGAPTAALEASEVLDVSEGLGVSAGRDGDFVWSVTLSYLVGALLLGALVFFAGVWNVLANTRLLDVLISGGIVRQNDVHLGFVDGLPDPELLLLTRDAIDWRLVGGVVALYFVFWGIKSLQFHASKFGSEVRECRE